MGMLDCKKALAETDGDMDKAVELAAREGPGCCPDQEGRHASPPRAWLTPRSSSDGVGVVVEVNAETDFVAKNARVHQGFVKDVCYVVGKWGPRGHGHPDDPALSQDRH